MHKVGLYDGSVVGEEIVPREKKIRHWRIEDPVCEDRILMEWMMEPREISIPGAIASTRLGGRESHK